MTQAAVLVNLTINQFGNEKTDRKIAQEVARSHNATVSDDRYLKRRLPISVMKGLNAQVSAIRTYHYTVTAPWFDRGIRMMAASFIPKYAAGINERKKTLFSMVEDVAKKIPELEADAIRTRGSLYQQGDFPDPDYFRKCYKVDVELLPVATEDDFRIDYISNEAKKKYTENNIRRFAAQTEHLISLVEEPLVRMKASMANQERSPKIHGSTIEALGWWADHIDALLVDRSKEREFLAIGNRIKTDITPGYDPDGRPKYSPEYIEPALYAIDDIQDLLKCIRE